MQESTNNRGANATKTKANKYALECLPAIKAAIADGAKTHAEVRDWLNEHGIPGPRGGAWCIETVRRMRDRLAELSHREVMGRRNYRCKSSKLYQLSPEERAKRYAEADAEWEKSRAAERAARGLR